MGVEGVGGRPEKHVQVHWSGSTRDACWPGHRGRVFYTGLAQPWHDPQVGQRKELSLQGNATLRQLLAGIYKELLGKHTSSSFCL